VGEELESELNFSHNFIGGPSKPPPIIEAPPILEAPPLLEAHPKPADMKDVLEAQGLVLCPRFLTVLQSRSFFQH